MPVRHEQEGSVSIVTIDRPERMNAFTPETAQALRSALDDAFEADETEAVVLEGAGDRAFCVGADLARFGRAIEEGDAVQVVSRSSGLMNEVIVQVVEAEQPVVACLNGTAAGGGLGLALACDLRVAADHARLTPGFLDVGVSPDGGTTWFLPRMVGTARAREILLRNEVLDAQTAKAEGLVTEVSADARLRAREVAAELADGPSFAIGSTKQRLLEQEAGLVEHLEREQEATALSAERSAFEEGVMAFLEKRAPSF